MLRSLPTLLLTTFAFVAPAVQAAPCAYTKVKPSALFTRVAADVERAGGVLAPASAFGGEGFLVVKDGLATGQVSFQRDQIHDEEVATFTTMEDQLLATFRFEVGVARDRRGEPSGSSRQIHIWTARDAADAGESSPFRLVDDPSGLRWYLFDREVGVTLWRVELGDALQWLSETLTNTEHGQGLKPTDGPTARFQQSFAIDPALIPYIGRLDTHFDRSGTMIVRGVVESNFIYGRILDTARELGIRLRPELIIDTRLHYERTDFPSLEACLR